jgi:hypothetical protein
VKPSVPCVASSCEDGGHSEEEGGGMEVDGGAKEGVYDIDEVSMLDELGMLLSNLPLI